jgi:hypothetical protein
MEDDSSAADDMTEAWDFLMQHTRRIAVWWDDVCVHLEAPLTNAAICAALRPHTADCDVRQVWDVYAEVFIVHNYVPNGKWVTVTLHDVCTAYDVFRNDSPSFRVHLAPGDVNNIATVFEGIYPDEPHTVIADIETPSIYVQSTYLAVWYTPPDAAGDALDAMPLRRDYVCSSIRLYEGSKCFTCGAPTAWYIDGHCKGYTINWLEQDGKTVVTSPFPCSDYSGANDMVSEFAPGRISMGGFDRPNMPYRIQHGRYQRVNHLMEWILRCIGCERTFIPLELLAAMRVHEASMGRSVEEMTKVRCAEVLECVARANPEWVRYRRNVTKVYYLLTEREEHPFIEPYGTGNVEDAKAFFNQCEHAFTRIDMKTKHGRRSMLPVSMVMMACFVHNGWRGAEYFTLIDSPDRRREHARILEQICAMNQWPTLRLSLSDESIYVQRDDGPHADAPRRTHPPPP